MNGWYEAPYHTDGSDTWLLRLGVWTCLVSFFSILFAFYIGMVAVLLVDIHARQVCVPGARAVYVYQADVAE